MCQEKKHQTILKQDFKERYSKCSLFWGSRPWWGRSKLLSIIQWWWKQWQREFNPKHMGWGQLPSGKPTKICKITIFHGKTHYFYGDFNHSFLYVHQRVWANYNNSLTWIKAIWGWFPLLTIVPVRSQWGRYNLPREGKPAMMMSPTTIQPLFNPGENHGIWPAYPDQTTRNKIVNMGH